MRIGLVWVFRVECVLWRRKKMEKKKIGKEKKKYRLVSIGRESRKKKWNKRG